MSWKFVFHVDIVKQHYCNYSQKQIKSMASAAGYEFFLYCGRVYFIHADEVIDTIIMEADLIR
jgi:hypothetical protein